MQKIGVLGGTFSPVHNGHIMLAEQALKEVGIDKVVFVPSGNSYLKQDVVSAEHRLNMLYLALKDNKNAFEVSLVDIARGGNSYTCDTIKDLNNSFNNKAELYLIMGADNLVDIHKWKNYEYIIKNAKLIVCKRKGTTNSEELYEKIEHYRGLGADITEIELPLDYQNLSSTQIREQIEKCKAENKRLSDIAEQNGVSKDVLNYIITNNLYA